MVGRTQIPPSPPLEKGGTSATDPGVETPPFSKGGQGGIPGATVTLNDYAPHLKPLARQLRTHQTDAERTLWHHLRRDQLSVRFYRQRPLGPYILDFFAPKAGLVVELDGNHHASDPTQRRKDHERDSWLMARGLRVLRFDDRQALLETQAVFEVILREVQQPTATVIPQEEFDGTKTLAKPPG